MFVRAGRDAALEPVLVVNPRTDDEFVALARRLAIDSVTPELLQQLLRERYPRALVRPRQLAGESGNVWYVYRDGRWTSQSAMGGRRQRHGRETG